MRAAAVALAILLAGCAAPGGDDAPAASESESGRWWLQSGGALGSTADDGQFPLAWSWSEWMQGTQAPAWSAPAADEPYILTSANVTVVYDTARTLAHTETRPPFTVWFGAGDGIVDHLFADGPQPWPAGSQQTITFEVRLPLGGLVVLPGDAPVLHVGTYYLDAEALGNTFIDLEGSFIDWTSDPVELPDASAEQALATSGSLQGGRCVEDVNPEGTAQAMIPFEVGPDVLGIDASLQRISGAGVGPDMDFRILDANGTTVSRAAGSSVPEAIHLRQPNMAEAEPGTWTLWVYNCHQQVSEYSVQADLLRS